MRNFPGSNFDLSGLDASPFEIGAVLDAVSEAEAEAEAGGGYDADDLGAAEWAASLTDAEFGDLMAEYEADQALAHLPGGPELAGADAGNATFDLANDGAQLDMMLSQLTNREATRQQQDADEMARRGGPHHRRPSAEIKLATAMRRVGDQNVHVRAGRPGCRPGYRRPVRRWPVAERGRGRPAHGLRAEGRREAAGPGRVPAAGGGPGYPDRAAVKAEIVPQGQDELVITLDTSELPLAASDAALKVKLPENAAGIADGVLSMIGQAPVPGDPRPVRVVHVRLVRTVTVAETTIMLDGERQVWA